MRKTAFLIALGWLILVWILFARGQYLPVIKASHAAGYIGAVIKVALSIVALTGLGLKILGRAATRQVDLLTAAAVGLAILGIASLLLAGSGLLRSVVIWPAVAAAAALSHRQVLAVVRRLARVSLSGYAPIEMIPVALLIVGAVIGLVNSLAPLSSNDALVYHLNVPRIYAVHGGLARLPFNVYANMPHYGEMLYAVFYGIGGESAAKIFYLFTVLAAAGSVARLARRFVDRNIALAAGAIFLIQPLVLDHRIVCNVDMMLAYFFVCGCALAFDLKPGRPRDLMGLALITGFMLGIKYTALPLCLSLLLIVLFGIRNRPSARAMLAAVAVAVLVVAPWLIKNQIWMDNPVYPVLEGAFDGANWDSVQSQQLVAWQRSMGMGRDVADYLLLPFNISVKAKPGLNYMRFDGTLSPLFLVLLPLALLRRKRRVTVLIAMAIVGFAFWALTSQQLRFLIPVMALAAVLSAIGISQLAERMPGRWHGVFLGLVLAATASLLVTPDQYGRPLLANTFGDRLGPVLGLETRRAHLERTVQSFAMFEHMNANLPPDEPVLMIWENRGYYLDRPYLADSFFEASTIMRMAARAGDAARLRDRIAEMGYKYVVVNDMLGEFFSRRYPPRETAILRSLVEDHLEPLHSADRLTLYRLRRD